MGARNLLELRGIRKKFGAFTALDDVNLRVSRGEIVGLLGENGAGKSTLLGILSGNQSPTDGELFWNAQPIRLTTPRHATALGIGIVHQHFQLVPSFTVAENLALAAPHTRLVFSENEWCERIVNWAHKLGWKIDASRRVEELGVGERQRIEILKALYAHTNFSAEKNGEHSESPTKLLLLDEPTANLTPIEVEELFGVLRRLKSQGCGLVFVSHKLNEVLTLCDRVMVLRHGQVVGERAIANTSADDLAELMVGHTIPQLKDKVATRQTGSEAALEIKHLSHGLLHDFSLKIHRGEIVGLAGVDGNGQAELAEVLGGLQRPRVGSFTVDNSKLAFIPPDRQHVGLIPHFSLAENMALHPALRVQCRKFLRFDWAAAKARTRELMKKFDVRAPQMQEASTASQLSGGNQQKLVIARALSFPHVIVIAADPTRGLDVAATQFVHQQLRNAASAGAGVLLISTDLDEVLALADRVGVFYEGRLFPDSQLISQPTSRETIGRLMGGISQPESGQDDATRSTLA
jgi:simple sugar transport system ATP-binding protein